MNYKHFIGIDVSKNWLDFTIQQGSQQLLHRRVVNSGSEIKSFFQELKKRKVLVLGQTLICMEHTGIYNNHLLDFLNKAQANVALESGVQIQRSIGLKRGKNDKVDSQRIAAYCYKNREDIQLWKPKREILLQLKNLTTLRNRLINASKQLNTPIKESKGFMDKKSQNKIAKLCNSSLKSLERDLNKINEEIKAVIKSDSELNRLFNLIVSVTGIGQVTATEIIVTTNEFKSIHCHKKYACYSGIAPFEHQSGSSVRGKTRVSSMGNKSIKKLLHLAALSAIAAKGDMRNYFERKVQEGKNKMLIINAVRNKLLARVFACVNQNRIYEKKYQNYLFNP